MENDRIDTSDSVSDIGQNENLPHEKPPKKSLLIIFGFLFLLLAGAVVYGFYMPYSTVKIQNKTLSTPTPVKPAQSGLLYTNDVYGYSVRYPKEWVVREATKQVANQSEGAGDILQSSENEVQKVTFVQEQSDGFQGYFEIRVLANPKNLSLDEWTQGYRIPLAANPSINLAKVQESTQLSGEQAKIITMNRLSYPGDEAVVSLHHGTIYFLQFFQIDPQGPDAQKLVPIKKIAEQILASFRFTK